MAIGTTAALVGSSIAGSAIQSSSARRATNAQTAAANQQLAVQERMFEQSREDLSPYREGGIPANNALNYYLGTAERPTDPNFVGFQETPGYEFAFNEGMRGIDASAASRGGLYSGATMQAAQTYGNGLANQEFGNYLARLSGQATLGSNAAAQSATVNTNNAQMQSNSLANLGNAQASGAIAQGNAFSGAINNGIGLWQYQNMLNRFPSASA